MKRESFRSRLGFLLVSAGCAIGIGNVWRFPYVTGENGGGFFVLIYLICLLVMGVPVLTMAAAATIATLAVPSLYEQSILFRFCVILLAGLFGVLGLTCAALMILAMACGSEPFGYDYLYPLMPPGKASVRDGFVRSIWSELAKAGEVIGRHEV